jgi:putative ABC transport system ATP-binding protein
MTQSTDMISAVDVCKDYRKGRLRVPALRGLSLRVGRGEFVALMGPSGSGKSTLLNLIGGLDCADAGQLRVDGVALRDLDDARRTAWRARHVGLVFQRHHLVTVLDAAQNVALPLMLRKMPRAERAARVADALQLVGLSQRARHLPSELSGGQEQRVAIARALVADAPLLLCDEPTGNLDAEAGAEVLAILRSLCDDFGKTIVLVTHDIGAAAIADRIVCLRDGELLPGPAAVVAAT